MKKLIHFFLAFLFIFLGFNFSTHSVHASTVGPRVYVSNDGDGTVSVIDSGTNTLITTIPVGQFPRGVVVSPEGTRLYVSNFTDCCSVNPGTVSVIDTATYAVIATIPVGNNPTGIAITPDGSHVYVSNYGFSAGDGTVSVIDTATNTVTTNITVSPGPWNMAMSGDGTRLYVSSTGSNAIAVIDTATNTVVSTITVPNHPAGMVLNPDGSRLFVANMSVSVIDTATNSILTTIPTDSSTGLLTINSTGSRVYAAANNKVLVIDATNNTLLTTIPVNPVPGGLAILPDDTKVYVPIDGSTTVSLIDTASNTVVGSVGVGLNPIAIAIEKQNHAPVVNSISNATINEGDTYSANGSFTDPDSTSWTGTVDYGDGTGVHNLPIDQTNHTFALSKDYQDEGTYHVSVVITDNQGASSTPATATITENNAQFTVNSITVSQAVVQTNTQITATATFSDPGVLDTHPSAIWDWGDGTTSTVTPDDNTKTVTGTHTYTTANVYAINVTVTDDDGLNESPASPFQYLSVYNPTSQGLFSAGQKFISPAGAYAANTSLTGTVKFGLSYKYQGTMPVGDKQFTMNFNAANLTFNATTISSLVIANGIGTLTGTGTINGSSSTYTFLVTGSESAKTIRIQIKDSTGNVVYDTQPGAAATATPTTSVTGNVLAH